MCGEFYARNLAQCPKNGKVAKRRLDSSGFFGQQRPYMNFSEKVKP